jgi:predicted permease
MRLIYLAAIASLALLTATSSGIISLLYVALLGPLPYTHADRLVALGKVPLNAPPSMGPAPASIPDFLDWRDASEADFEGLSALQYRLLTAVLPSGTRAIDAAMATPNLFSMLGVQAAIGALFSDNEDELPVVVLSHAFWQAQYGSRPAIGTTIKISAFDTSNAYTVIGVLPESFQLRYPRDYDVYMPLSLRGVDRAGPARRAATLRIFGRLRPDISLATAAGHIRSITARLNAQYTSSPQDATSRVVPIRTALVGTNRRYLYSLTACALVALIAGFVNVASLLFAGCLARHAEFLTRLALGCSIFRLRTALLLEHLCLCGVGVISGVALGALASRVLVVLAPADLPHLTASALTWQPLSWTFLIALACAGFTSWLPAFRATRHLSAVSSSFRMTQAPADRRAHDTLMICQIAIVLALLTAAAAFDRSLQLLLRVPLGFHPENVTAVRLRFDQRYYGVGGMALMDRLSTIISATPGVAAVGWTSELPLSGHDAVVFHLSDAPPQSALLRYIDAQYINVMRATIVDGHAFSTDVANRSSDEVIVNRSFASRYLSDALPIGTRIYVDTSRVVVGVIDDIHENTLSSSDEPAIYLPFNAEHWMTGAPWLVVRAQSPPDGLRAAIARIDPDVAILRTAVLTQLVADATAPIRFLSLLLTCLGVGSLVCASLGFFSMASHVASRREAEFAIRLALGSTPSAVRRLIIRHVLTISGVGTCIGILISSVANMPLSALLYGVQMMSVDIILPVIAIVLMSTCAATFVPASRAASLNPIDVMRRLDT